jgi:regulation of enolase protein 1 (concanavalin A-like superfamily)
MLQKTLSLMLCASGLSISAALGFSTDPSSLARNFNTTSATTNAPIVVTSTFTNGGGVALRGFCYTEQIPSGLNVTTLGLSLNGQSVANYTFEFGLDSDVYPGCTPYRWVLELPTGFTENNPVPPNATVQIQYSITSPAVGSFNLQQFSWAGYNPANTNASFGYSESSDAQSVSFNAGSPPSYPILTTATSIMNFSTNPGTNPASQTLGITNSGGGTMSWTAVANGSAPAWLSVNPTNGTGNGAVSVSVASASLAAGTYTKSITVTAVGATNSPQTVAVTLTVNQPAPAPNLAVNPTALNFNVMQGTNPASQTLGITNSGGGTLTWTAVADGTAPAWLSVNPSNGTGNGAVSVSVASASLAAGTYTKSITVTAVGATNSPQTVMVGLTVNASGTVHYNFTYANRTSLLAGGWDFLARTASGATRNTEITNPAVGAVVSYDQVAHPGVLRIPADIGDLWAAQNNTRNSLFRDVPTNWTSLRLKLSFAPTQNYQQAGLAVYQDDDNYVYVDRIYNGGNLITCSWEVGGAASILNSGSVTATTNLNLRLDRAAGSGAVSAYYSLDGTNWVLLGSVTQGLSRPRLGIFVGSSPGGFPNGDLAWAEVTAPQSNPILAVSPGSLTFSAVAGTSPANQVLGITNAGGGTLSWTAVADGSTPAWLTVNPTNGTGNGAVSVSVASASLAAGTYTKSITVTAVGATNSPQTVIVNLTVNPSASSLAVNPTALNFNVMQGANPANQMLAITNSGGGTMSWTAVANGSAPAWLSVNPTNGTGNGAVSVSVASASLAAGTYTKSITVTAVGATNSPQTVAVTLTVNQPAPAPNLAVNPTALNFNVMQGTNPASQTLGITNSGGGTLTWTAVADGTAPAWLSVNPSNGTGNGAVSVSVASASLAAGTYTKSITVTAVGATNSPQTVMVGLTVNASGTVHYNFTYANRTSLLAGGWDFLARTASGATRNTEITNPAVGAVVSYDQVAHPGVLRIPADIGDLWAAQNNTRNSLFRDVPTNWTSLRLKLSFAPTQNYQQAGLAVYQDDDNYVYVDRIYNGGNLITCSWEVGGAASILNSGSVTATTNLNLRLDRAAGSGAVSAYYSLDGTNWVLLGSVTQGLSRPRLGIFVGSSPGGFPNGDLAWAEVTAPQSNPILAVSPGSLTFSAVAGTSPANQVLGITNAGGGTLSWTAVADGSTPAWLTVNPTNGTGNGAVSVSVASASLAAGTYTKSITVTAVGATNSPQTVAVTLTVSQPAPAPNLTISPATLSFNVVQGSSPTNQVPGITNSGGGTLTWTAVADGTAPAWLTVNPTNGTGNGAMSVSVASASLAAGTYTKSITVTAVGATNSPQTVMVGLTVSSVEMVAPGFANDKFGFDLDTQLGVSYIVEYKGLLSDPSWTMLTNVLGTGSILRIEDPAISSTSRFYRVRAP